MDLDRDVCYRAMITRDPRFDGRFYVAVLTTRVYCRPICPAPAPKRENCVFLPSAAAAHQAGFRPCLRCRPELAPGMAGWRGPERAVSQALHLIVDGGLEEGGTEALAGRLGIGGRQLRRLFDKHVGASPIAVTQTHRILFAKRLISETEMSMAEVAYAAGFGSVRRFNHVMRRTYGRPPRELRRFAPDRGGRTSGIALKLPFSPPYNWPAIVAFLAPRAIPGVESVTQNSYRRTIAVEEAYGTVDVRPTEGQNHLVATIRISNVAALAPVVARLRTLFDLDVDIAAVEAHLGCHPRLGPCVARCPGLRVPGAWDGFELAVRAILGQQISVAAATTLAGRLTAAYGVPLAADQTLAADPGLRYFFPRPAALCDANLASIGLPRARAGAISALATAVVADRDLLCRADGLDATIDRLSLLPGIGAWTAQYIAMRALHEPDAFPAADLGLSRALARGARRPTPAELSTAAQAWRPWRAYAVMHLWMEHTETTLREKKKGGSVCRPPRRRGDRSSERVPVTGG